MSAGRLEGCRCCGASLRPLVDRGDLALYRCVACGLVSGEPAVEVPAAERYAEYHAGGQAPAPDDRYHEWLAWAEATVGVGRLLEVGAGAGGLVRVALQRGWRVDATEVSASALARLRELGAHVVGGDVVDAGYAEGTFDLVACVEVVEHLPAPLATLTELCRVTRPGGLLLLTTPSFNGLSRRVFGARWRVVDPEHLAYFTPAALSRALRRAGYRDVTVRARSLDLGAWSAPGAKFEPATTARRREAVHASPGLRLAKRALDAVLGATGLGDSLLARGCK